MWMLKVSRNVWKTVDTCPFVFDSVPDQYLIQEMCNKVVSKEPFKPKQCLNRDDPRDVW